MRHLSSLLVVVALGWASLFSCGCEDPSARFGDDGSGDGDLPPDTAGNDSGQDVNDADSADVTDRGEVLAEPGPLTLVATEVEMVSQRLCDLDGDGRDDNSVADLGASAGGMLAMAVNSTVQGNIDSGGFRLVVHFPWVDDRGGPSEEGAPLLTFGALDTDEPMEPEDDFSGNEPFFAGGFYVDGCGEPRCFINGAHLADGELTATGGTVALPFVGLRGRGTVVTGSIRGRGESAELFACSYALIHEAGETDPPTPIGEATMLEMFLAGGTPWGLPTIPGVNPDIDLDGDGLERFIVDGEGLIETCIDGDGTAIEGRDCWQDERIADAFSLVVRIEAVGAVFAGLAPDWDDWAVGECEAGPPAVSLFDPS